MSVLFVFGQVRRLAIKQPAFYWFLQIPREPGERETEADSAPGRRKTHNFDRPHQCAQGIFEGIDEKVDYEIDDSTIEQVANSGDILGNRADLENNEGDRETTSVEPAAAYSPDLSKPGTKPAV